MRKIILALTAVAAVVLGSSVAERANAVPLGDPAGMAAAIDNGVVLDQVHCRPGWRHHAPTRWRRASGCRRGGGVVVVTPGIHAFGWHRGHRGGWRGGHRWRHR